MGIVSQAFFHLLAMGLDACVTWSARKLLIQRGCFVGWCCSVVQSISICPGHQAWNFFKDGLDRSEFNYMCRNFLVYDS
jgi:hypothetical protein